MVELHTRHADHALQWDALANQTQAIRHTSNCSRILSSDKSYQSDGNRQMFSTTSTSSRAVKQTLARILSCVLLTFCFFFFFFAASVLLSPSALRFFFFSTKGCMIQR